jgi:dihydroorotase
MIPIGIPGLETTLPLFLTEVKKGRISLERLVNVLSREPPKVLGISQNGIEQGANADLVIVDLKKEAKIDSSKFFSKAKYSPFDGTRVTGWPVKTFISGQLVFDQGHIVSKPGSGHVLTPKSLEVS